MDIFSIGLGSTFRHKKTNKVYVVVRIIENKTNDSMGIIYHWIGAPKGFERTYYRDWKDFKSSFEIVETKDVKHSDLVSNIWDIAKTIIERMKKCYNAPSENSENVPWEQIEGEWFDYIIEKTEINNYKIK